MVLIMNETTQERKNRLNQLHKAWLDVTGSALSALHKTDGYKGDRKGYRMPASTQEYSLSVGGRLDK